MRSNVNLAALFSRLVCFARGHHYRPVEEMFYILRRGKHKRRYRYECDSCGKPTKAMTQAELQVFKKEQCPTWGGRGYDSQGYRDEN